jgi:hypothetical protein
VDVAGLAAPGDRVVGEQFAVALLPRVLTAGAEHSLEGVGTVGACAVRRLRSTSRSTWDRRNLSRRARSARTLYPARMPAWRHGRRCARRASSSE